ncbi:hypothetical protein [Gloeomargarita sp.]
MQGLRLYLLAMTVVWLGLLLGVVLPALRQGTVGLAEVTTLAERLWAGAVLTLPVSLTLAVVLSWWCWGRRWERWALYSSLLPGLNVLVAGGAWLWLRVKG